MLEEKEVITLLGDLMSINSVNPLEDTSRQGEKELAFYVRDYLKNIGIQSTLQWVLSERPIAWCVSFYHRTLRNSIPLKECGELPGDR